MQTNRILVADWNDTLRNNLVEHLQAQRGIAEVIGVGDGVAALKLLQEKHFDVVIAEFMMPLMDGYSLMEAMREQQISSKVLVTSPVMREDFIMRAIDMGACNYIIKPYTVEQVARQVELLLSGDPDTLISPGYYPSIRPKGNPLDETLSALFLSLGIPAHIKGFHYLRYAVRLVIEQPDMINRITKELYPTIGKHFQTSASKVERAIRHAIEVAWNRGRVDTLNRAFGCKLCSPEDKPTNGEFVALLADQLSYTHSA